MTQQFHLWCKTPKFLRRDFNRYGTSVFIAALATIPKQWEKTQVLSNR